jgi:Uncharacterised nucleotidyltransferase
LALLAESLLRRKDLTLPDGVLAAVVLAARQESAGQLAMQAEQRRVCAALVSAGLPFLILKGGALAHWLYPQAHLRLVTDLDLLLPNQTSLGSLAMVLAGIGYIQPPQAGSRIGKEHPFLKAGGPYGQFTVDAHWALLNSPILADCFEFAELYTESRELPNCHGARGLSPVHALLNAVGHRALNLPYTYVQGIQNAHSLRWLWDIHLLVQVLNAEQWKQLDSLARRTGLCGILADALQSAASALCSPVPSNYLAEWCIQAKHERIRTSWFNSWPSYQWQQFLASADTLTGRLQWLYQRLWPNVEAMRARYGHDGDSDQRVLWRRFAIGLRRLFGVK